MKKANSLNEQIERILKVSDYKIQGSKRSLVEMLTPLGEVAPMAPAQAQATAQGEAPAASAEPQNNQQNDAAFEREIDTAMNQLMQTLPAELQKVATTQGDRDGQLEPVGQESQQATPARPTNNATQSTQTPVAPTGTARVAEGAGLDEAIGALIGGAAMALPAITGLVGKGLSFLGAKADNETITAIGHKVEHAAHSLHSKYLKVLQGIISPYIASLPPVMQKQVTNGVFYAIVAALGVAGAAGAAHAAHGGNIGLASVEGGLTTVKASEILNAAKEIIPRILSTVVA